MALPNMTEISTAIRGLMPQLRPTPVGLIGYFHDIPDGWLLCNGAAVSRTTYAKLFNVIGTRYGKGDGSTTFNLPNLEGRFLESTTDVSKLGQFVEAGLPDITGSLKDFAGRSLFGTNNIGHSGALRKTAVSNTQTVALGNSGVSTYGVLELNATWSNTTYGSSETVQPSGLRVIPCIKS